MKLNEKIVLIYTATLKSSYGRSKSYRFHSANKEQGISLQEWNKAKTDLIAKGFLNKVGAITSTGKNSISHFSLSEKQSFMYQNY